MADMTTLQEAYKKLREKKAERKEIKSAFSHELDNHARYQEIAEEIAKLREEKKSIEAECYARALADAQRLDELAADVKSHEALISDLAFNLLLTEKTVQVVDEYNNAYEPVFVVRFKKTGDVVRPENVVS